MTGEHPTPESLDRYLDCAIAPVEESALEAHIAGCATCRAELAALREVWAELAALPPERLPVDLTPAVLARLESPLLRWQAVALGATLAAQVVVAVLLAGWLARWLPAWAGIAHWLPSTATLVALAPPRGPLPADSLLLGALASAAVIWLIGNGVLLRARIVEH
ncbi:MAG: zf-HC2 domain-containing protein [Thermomicrobiales bacterium]